jgi:hypothetical protein
VNEPHLRIACSLSAAVLRSRQAQMTILGRDALVGASVDGTHAELSFARSAGVRERVDDLVAAERRCCAFLTMAVSDEPGRIVLSIDAPPDADAVLAEFVQSFGATR